MQSQREVHLVKKYKSNELPTPNNNLDFDYDMADIVKL